MIYRIAGGIFLILTGLAAIGFIGVPAAIIGLCAIVAGIALLAGV
jgi:hypothetical protein